tara:strand:+ start:376 stop:966 length:591 start_codon:yes stop_codon:yes gene_type:complete
MALYPKNNITGHLEYTSIDKTSWIDKGCLLNSYEKSKINIGKYCAIAQNFVIQTVNHDYNFPSLSGYIYQYLFNEPPFYGKHPGELCPQTNERSKGDVNIGNDVCIGRNVYISSGVKVGDGCYIGAHSVVTKDLPPFTICVGVPCKPVKDRYNNQVKEFLLELKWWDWDEAKIKRNKDFFYLNLNEIPDINKIKIN